MSRVNGSASLVQPRLLVSGLGCFILGNKTGQREEAFDQRHSSGTHNQQDGQPTSSVFCI